MESTLRRQRGTAPAHDLEGEFRLPPRRRRLSSPVMAVGLLGIVALCLLLMQCIVNAPDTSDDMEEFSAVAKRGHLLASSSGDSSSRAGMGGRSLLASTTAPLSKRLAYVTLLCDDIMWKSTAVLLQSLQDVNATAPFVILVLPHVSEQVKHVLTAMGATVIVKAELPYPWKVCDVQHWCLLQRPTVWI